MKAVKRAVFITLFLTLCVLLFFVVVKTLSKWSDSLVKSDSLRSGKAEVADAPNPPEIATEIIFVTDDDELAGCYLSELDTLNVRWRLNVIPLDTRISLSASLYRELAKNNVTVPQVATLSELYRSLTGDKAAADCTKVVSELLGFTPTSMLVLPAKDFEKVIRKSPEQYVYADFLTESFIEEISGETGLWTFFASFFEGRESSLSTAQRLFYLETCESLTNQRISCRLIPGTRHNNGYEVKTTTDDFYRR